MSAADAFWGADEDDLQFGGESTEEGTLSYKSLLYINFYALLAPGTESEHKASIKT